MASHLVFVVMPQVQSADDLRRRVDDELLAFLETERASVDPDAHPLVDELEALTRAGGKRLRPRFCYWGFRAGGGADCVEIIRVGAALELLHTFALIFDDVMDRSPVRRRRPAAFKGLEAGRTEGLFGVSAALLSGLLGFVLADRLLWTSGFGGDRLRRITERFDRMRMRAIGGQYLDILAARRRDASEEMIRRIGALKSGAYTVVDPLAIGALAAGASDDVLRPLAAYGAPLGESFQIVDDILGTFGDPSKTGKDRDGDLREGKQTVLLARTRRLADAQDRSFLDATVGNALEPEAADVVREIMVRSGALESTRSLAASLADEAIAALAPGDLPTDAVDALHQLAAEATLRDA